MLRKDFSPMYFLSSLGAGGGLAVSFFMYLNFLIPHKGVAMATFDFIYPFAILGFTIGGYYAFKIFIAYFSRLIRTGDFDFVQNNNLSQMIAIFAFVMVGVGFAAPGAMSHNLTINAIGIFGAIFFSSMAVLLIVIKLVLGFKGMFKQGIKIEVTPSLWIMIPILTLLGITFVRISFGLAHHFDQELDHSSLFTLTSSIVALQLIFGFLGYQVMKEMKNQLLVSL